MVSIYPHFNIKDGKIDTEELRKYLQHGVMQRQLDELVSVLHKDWSAMTIEEGQVLKIKI